MNKKQVLYAVLAVVLVLQVVSVSTDDWLKGNNNDTHMGLWNSCNMSEGCGEISADKFALVNSLNAVRALTVVAIVLTFCACCCMCNNMSMLGMKQHQLLVVAGVANLVATVVWLKEFKAKKLYKDAHMDDLGYSFHLNWVAGVLLLGAACYKTMGYKTMG